MRFPSLIIYILLIQSAGCASRHAVPNEYRSAIRERAGKTVSGAPAAFVIVIDGFGMTTYRRAIRAGNIPEMERFFTAYRGEAVFPTLTHPNLASIVTASTPRQHPISGNQIHWKGEDFRLDHWRDNGYLNQLLRGSTLFQAIRERGGTSVSLSYAISEGATVAIKPDVKTGVAYETHQFSYIDGKIADALDQLVDGPLPDFTFVHFIGVDSLSHQYGPEDRRVQAHLRELDLSLGRFFHKIRRLEREGVKTRVALTADHGFVTIHGSSDLEPILSRSCDGTRSFNQVRILTLYGRVNESCASRLSQAGGVDAVLFRNLTGYRAGRKVVLSQTTDRPTLQKLKDFFSSASAPEAIVLPRAGIGFGPAGSFGADLHLGDHGAMTGEELEVPVLLHGDNIQLLFNEAGLIPTHRILKDDLAAWNSGHATAQRTRWQPKFRFQLEVPVAALRYRSRYLADRGKEDAREYRNGLSPWLKTTMDIVWSEHWATRGYYSAFFSSYIPGNLGYHEVGGSLRYRMHSGTFLFGSYSSGERPFRIGPDAEQDWTKQWVRTLSFGTQGSLLSFGFGELLAKGELGVLFPGEIENADATAISYSTGFREASSLVFEYDLDSDDSLSFELGLAHETQNSKLENRETLGWIFGTTYRLQL